MIHYAELVFTKSCRIFITLVVCDCDRRAFVQNPWTTKAADHGVSRKTEGGKAAHAENSEEDSDEENGNRTGTDWLGDWTGWRREFCSSAPLVVMCELFGENLVCVQHIDVDQQNCSVTGHYWRGW